MRRFLSLLLASFFGVAVALVARAVLPGRSPDVVAQAAEKEPETAHENLAFVPLSPDSVPALSSGFLRDETPEKPVYLRGFVVRGRHFNALLSDGRTLTELDGLVDEVRRNGLLMKDGKFIGFRMIQRGGEIAAKSNASVTKPVEESKVEKSNP